jgi:hypothetical protein
MLRRDYVGMRKAEGAVIAVNWGTAVAQGPLPVCKCVCIYIYIYESPGGMVSRAINRYHTFRTVPIRGYCWNT